MGKNLLTVKDLTVNVEEKEILHGVNLTIGKGETHVRLDRMVPESRRLAIRCSAIRNIT